MFIGIHMCIHSQTHAHVFTHVCLRPDCTHSASPVQDNPSPVLPLLHMQLKLPSVFMQVACASQGLSTVHSMLSEREKERVIKAGCETARYVYRQTG